jgi:hypothetical protein
MSHYKRYIFLDDQLKNQLNFAIKSFKTSNSSLNTVYKPKTLPNVVTKTASSSVSSECQLDSLKRSVHEELVNLIKNGVFLSNSKNREKSFTMGSKSSNKLSKTLLRLHNRRYEVEQNSNELLQENGVNKNSGSKSLPPNMVGFQLGDEEISTTSALLPQLPPSPPSPPPPITPVILTEASNSSSSSASISSSNLSKSSITTIVFKSTFENKIDSLNKKRNSLVNGNRIKSATLTTNKKLILTNNENDLNNNALAQKNINGEQKLLVKRVIDQPQKTQQKSFIRGGFNTLKHSVSFNIKCNFLSVL